MPRSRGWKCAWLALLAGPSLLFWGDCLNAMIQRVIVDVVIDEAGARQWL